MGTKESVLVIDAVPQNLPINYTSSIPSSIGTNTCKITNFHLKELLKDITNEEYKSIFFLLMDYIEPKTVLNLPKEKKILMQEFVKLYSNYNDCDILIELFSTMKKYKLLRSLDTCKHKCVQEREFNHIDAVWKMLYALCEELTDEELNILKHKIPGNSKDLILTAEDWFCWGLMNTCFFKTDLSKLEVIFNNFPRCLEIIKTFQVKVNFYNVRISTRDLHCGIALIINFETFVEKSTLERRQGSDIDVGNLKCLWEAYGFKTVVLTNLTCSATFEKLNYYAAFDHSNYDIFVCCILSHGKSNSIFSSDGETIAIPDIIATITNNCRSLHEKPKLFFIQACQGKFILEGVGKRVYAINSDDKFTNDTCNGERNILVPPIACDTLRVTSSIDGFVSFRNRMKGSLFIQTLYNSMMQSGDKKSILDIITEVNNEVRKCSAQQLSNYFGADGPKRAQQIINCSNTFGKTLILKKRIN